MASRTERPVLTRAAIVAVAVALADAEGLDAVSIRRIAAELPARPMSLYNHISGKDELVGLMVDHVAGEGLIGEALSDDWRAALRQIAVATRASALKHPWLTAAMGRALEERTNMVRHREESLRAVAALPGTEAEKVRLLVAVDTYTLGRIVFETALGPRSLADQGIPDDTFEAGLEWLLDGAAAAFGVA